MLGASRPPHDAWLLPVLGYLLDPASLNGLQRHATTSLWTCVVEEGLVDDRTLLEEAARHLRLPVADLSAVSPHALELVEERWARRHIVLPLSASPRELYVATANPFDVDAERALAFAAARRIRFALTSPVGLAERIERAYHRAPLLADVAPLATDVPDVEHLTLETEPSADDAASVTRLLDRLLAEGIAAGASDIHVEPEESGIAVRHRIDGMLRLVHTIPRGVASALVSRVKIVSGLDIADRLRPQDGRARVAVAGRAVDLRVSTLPAALGEKVVVRILDDRGSVHALDDMGLSRDERARLQRLLEMREGLILVTGPTGSGKTTTLYAALREVLRRGVNIVTVEDPIEYRLPGVSQVQVRERSGLSFATALRSIMRQDPDVILVGEIRDRETAEIAIQASLTGHLVLSTLHTNDAASAVTRLLDMGVASHKLATALKGVVAQRLVRRRCGSCRSEPADPACGVCGGAGFRGRLAVMEILLADAEIERLIAAGSPAEPIAAAARRTGMHSLWESGLTHVHGGRTTIEELLRVVEPPWTAAASAQAVHHRRAAPPRQSSRATFMALRLRRTGGGASPGLGAGVEWPARSVADVTPDRPL